MLDNWNKDIFQLTCENRRLKRQILQYRFIAICSTLAVIGVIFVALVLGE